MAGGRAELLDLDVGVVEVFGRGLDQDRNVKCLHAVYQARCILRGDNEIRGEGGDGLDVWRETGQLSLGSSRGVVRLVVDRDDLRPRAQREQHLASAWRERAD